MSGPRIPETLRGGNEHGPVAWIVVCVLMTVIVAAAAAFLIVTPPTGAETPNAAKSSMERDSTATEPEVDR